VVIGVASTAPGYKLLQVADRPLLVVPA